MTTKIPTVMTRSRHFSTNTINATLTPMVSAAYAMRVAGVNAMEVPSG